jgi:hypothetical protein
LIPKIGVCEQSSQGSMQGRRIPWVNQKTVYSVLHNFGVPADSTRDYRCTQKEHLEQSMGQALIFRVQHEHIGRADVERNLLMGHVAQEVHAPGQAQLGGQLAPLLFHPPPPTNPRPRAIPEGLQ